MAAAVKSSALPRGVWICVALGAFLHIARLPHRAVEATWDYATYHLPLMSSLSAPDADLVDHLKSLFALQGLHPPLHALTQIAAEALSPTFLGYLLPSAIATSAAPLFVALAALELAGRRGALYAALIMALSPALLLYGSEALSYPWLTLGLSILLYGGARYWKGKGLWMLVLGVILAGYAHLLGAVAGVGLTLELMRSPRPKGAALPPFKGAAILALYLPLIWAAITALNEGEARQGAFELSTWAQGLTSRFGWRGALELSLLALGAALSLRASGARLALNTALAMALAYGASLWIGAAASHQFPYLTALIPPLALMAGLGVQTLPPRLALTLTALTALSLGGASASFMLNQNQALRQAANHINLPPLLDATPQGSALFLITNYHPDDDKTHPSPTLLSLGLSAPLKNAEPCSAPAPTQGAHTQGAHTLDAHSHHFGQPRGYQGRTLRLFTKVAPQYINQAISCHHSLGEGVYLLPYGDTKALKTSIQRLQTTHEAYPIKDLPGVYLPPAQASPGASPQGGN